MKDINILFGNIINDASRNYQSTIQQNGDCYVDRPKKLPRNLPCPCGSGKKYKKCCFIKGIYENITIEEKQINPDILHTFDHISGVSFDVALSPGQDNKYEAYRYNADGTGDYEPLDIHYKYPPTLKEVMEDLEDDIKELDNGITTST